MRDETSYWLLPWKHNEHSAELVARSALDEAGDEAIIVADSTSVYPLWLVQQLEGKGEKIIVTTSVPDDAESKVVYSATPRPGFERVNPDDMLFKSK